MSHPCPYTFQQMSTYEFITLFTFYYCLSVQVLLPEPSCANRVPSQLPSSSDRSTSQVDTHRLINLPQQNGRPTAIPIHNHNNMHLPVRKKDISLDRQSLRAKIRLSPRHKKRSIHLRKRHHSAEITGRPTE